MISFFFNRIFLTIAIVSLVLTVSGQYKTFLIVGPDSTSDFHTIQAAIDDTKAFPDLPITIYIKNGVYSEKVHVYEWNTHLTLEGETRDSVIITWSDHFKEINKGRNSTFHTATLQVDANDFKARNLTILNSAGPVGQAIALSVTGDRCAFFNCIISGHQDTLYLSGENRRQYFKNCSISGTTDFIFGNATALFENCQIVSLSDSYITAASTEQGSSYGFVFKNCSLESKNATKVYLGRPWRAYAKTVFIQCHMGSHILPAGWHNWNRPENESTSYYAEYQSSGPGINRALRVEWSHQVSTRTFKKKYSNLEILRNWIP